MTIYKDSSQGLFFGMALPLVAMPYCPLTEWGARGCWCWRHLLSKVGRRTFFLFINVTYGLHHVYVFSFHHSSSSDCWATIIKKTMAFKTVYGKPFYPQCNPFSSRWTLFPLSWHKHRLRAGILSFFFPCFYLQWSRHNRTAWSARKIEFEQGVAFLAWQHVSMLSATMTATSSIPMMSAPPILYLIQRILWVCE